MIEDVQPAASGGDIDLPDALRRTATGLIKDLRALGFRDEPEGYDELAKAERRAVQSLLDSGDPRLAMDGLRVVREIERERRKVAELELAHAKAGMEALVFHHLGRMRMQGEQQAQGPSPENVSAGLSKMLSELMAQDKADNPAPSPEAETTPEHTDEPTP